MALFYFGKKKEEKKHSTCCCGSLVSEAEEKTGCCVKVLGTGCKTCHQQYENVKEAVRNLSLPVRVEYITDPEQIMEYGVMGMQAIVIDEKVAVSGKLHSAGAVEKLLQE